MWGAIMLIMNEVTFSWNIFMAKDSALWDDVPVQFKISFNRFQFSLARSLVQNFHSASSDIDFNSLACKFSIEHPNIYFRFAAKLPSFQPTSRVLHLLGTRTCSSVSNLTSSLSSSTTDASADFILSESVTLLGVDRFFLAVLAALFSAPRIRTREDWTLLEPRLSTSTHWVTQFRKTEQKRKFFNCWQWCEYANGLWKTVKVMNFEYWRQYYLKKLFLR